MDGVLVEARYHEFTCAAAPDIAAANGKCRKMMMIEVYAVAGACAKCVLRSHAAHRKV